jgi:hypothetical protein
MKKYNLLSIILLAVTLSNCGDTKKGENTLFTFDNTIVKKYEPRKLDLAITNDKSRELTALFITSMINK